MSLVDQYKEDRAVTKTMVMATFERDAVPQEMIGRYFASYDEETAVGIEIAEWLDNARKEADGS